MALIESFAILVFLTFACCVLHFTILFSLFPTSVFSPSTSVSPFRFLLALFWPLYVSIRARRRRKLTIGAAILAFVMGVTLTVCSYTYMVLMLTFFFSSIRLSSFKKQLKKTMQHSTSSEGDRDWAQVMANGGVPLLVCLLSLLNSSSLPYERPINFNRDSTSSFYDLAVLGALACATGDTWASELGTVTGTAEPRLITTGRAVPRGTNGGVSVIGLLASLSGGALMGLMHWVCVFVTSSRLAYQQSQTQLLLLPLGAFLGLFGSLVDSFLGATCQFSGM